MKPSLEIRFPLVWPEDQPVTEQKIAKRAFSRLIYKDLLQMNAIIEANKHIDRAVLTSNLKINSIGQIHGRVSGNYNPGASLILTIRNKPFILACDKYDRTLPNIHEIVKTLQHYHRIWKSGLKLQSIEIVNA